MNFLFISGQGEGLGLALRLKEQKYRVTCWIREGTAKSNYDRLLYKKHWESVLDDKPVVVFDSIGGGKTAERLKNDGFRVIGASMFADMVEHDWEAAKDVLGSTGLEFTTRPIPPLYNIEGWFDGKDFIDHTTWYLRRTRLMNGDLGPRTSCSGTLIWTENTCSVRMVQLAQLLAYQNYIGPVSLSSDIEGRIFDIVLRFTYDTLPAWLGLTEEIDQLLEKDLPPQSSDKFAAAVRVSLPGYGYPSKVREEFVIPNMAQQVRELSREDLPHLYLYDCKLDVENRLWTTGRRVPFVATGTGDTPTRAFQQAYYTAGKAILPDKQYRTDLVEVFHKDIETMCKHSVGGL